MRETRADTVRALLFAIALHVLLFALVLIGMWWTRAAVPISAAGSPVQADIVDPNALSASMQRALRSLPSTPPAQPPPSVQPPPQDVPVSKPETAPPPQPQAQERIPVPDAIDQEQVERDALSAETRQHEQDEKHRQEQIDLTQQQRQAEAESRQHLAQMEAQRLQQLAERIRKIREERRAAAHDADLAEQKLKQIADAQSRNPAQAAAQADAESSASPPPGNNGDAGLAARYAAALTEAILQNWTRPENVPNGQRCRITIRQVVGGDVIDVQVDPSCPYDEAGRRSVEAAVLKARPLPYAGFEKVFRRNLELDFVPHD
ncbi:MAG: TonB C-terminal protein [Xanthomonadaceae bacterium]|nr:TonB C-terminal protein [Xanthomonadaceae bacterium]